MVHRESDVANIDMIGRMIRAAGHRVGGYDPDQLVRLAAIREVLDAAIVDAVTGQRSQGITWQSIGDALGITRQAALMGYAARRRRAS